METVYSDGITKIKDPFWDNLCPMCGKRFWSVGLNSKCPDCGNKKLYVLNKTNHSKGDLERFGKRMMEEES